MWTKNICDLVWALLDFQSRRQLFGIFKTILDMGTQKAIPTSRWHLLVQSWKQKTYKIMDSGQIKDFETT